MHALNNRGLCTIKGVCQQVHMGNLSDGNVGIFKPTLLLNENRMSYNQWEMHQNVIEVNTRSILEDLKWINLVTL